MRGILFKPEMIEAIREGRKTVTRRVIPYQFTLPPEAGKPYLSGGFLSVIPNRINFKGWAYITDNKGKKIKPLYRVGEGVYIKEAYRHYGNTANLGLWVADVQYKLGNETRHIPFNDHRPCSEKWWNTGKGLDYFQTPLFMPMWAARYFIKITNVKPERLQDITEEDAIAEGIMVKAITTQGMQVIDEPSYIDAFAMLWDIINPKYPFDTNPFVWKIEFLRGRDKRR